MVATEYVAAAHPLRIAECVVDQEVVPVLAVQLSEVAAEIGLTVPDPLAEVAAAAVMTAEALAVVDEAEVVVTAITYSRRIINEVTYLRSVKAELDFGLSRLIMTDAKPIYSAFEEREVDRQAIKLSRSLSGNACSLGTTKILKKAEVVF